MSIARRIQMKLNCHHKLMVGAMLAGLASSPVLTENLQAQDFFDSNDRSLSVHDLTNQSGLLVYGLEDGDALGRNVNGIGDFNHDGIDDLAISASGADLVGGGSGEVYVIFGSDGGFADLEFEISDIDGSNGVQFNNVAGGTLLGRYGLSGEHDVNGDGIDDLLMVNKADDTAYIVFGSSNPFSSVIEISSLSTGDILNFSIQASGSIARGVLLPDLNGDGIGEIAVSDYRYNTNTGRIYVIFGSTDFSSTSQLDWSDINGTNGFVINGTSTATNTGPGLNSAGDINGDGYKDLMVGAPFAPDNRGSVFVVFGISSGFPASFDLSSLNGSNGFQVIGAATNNRIGTPTSGGSDLNQDGIDDIVIGNRWGNQAVMVYGSDSGFPATIDMASLDPAVAFDIEGSPPDVLRVGRDVTQNGDLNDDGFPDLIVSSDSAYSSGAAFVIFGGPDFPDSSPFDITTIDGGNGKVITGDGASLFGLNVANNADINNDGIEDIIIGSDQANTNGLTENGVAYIIFGSPDTTPTTPTIASIDSPTSRTAITGVALDFDDYISTPTLTVGDFTTNGVTVDAINGGPQNFTLDLTVTGGDGTKSIQLPAGAVEDLATTPNLSLASNVVSFTLDTDSPAFTTRVFSSNNSTNADYARTGDTVTITLEADEPVTTPTVALSGFAIPATGGPVNWTAVRVLDGTITDGGKFLQVSDFKDLAGNNGSNTNTNIDTAGNNLIIDNDPPSISSPLAPISGQANPTSTQPIVFEVSFGPSGLFQFDETSIDLSSSTAAGTLSATVGVTKSNNKGGGDVFYNISVSGATGSGDIVVNLVPASIFDHAGNILPSAGPPATVQYLDTTSVDEWMVLNQ